MKDIKIAIVGLGKIARDQHIPSIANNDSFELIAIASPHSSLEEAPSYKDIQTMLQAVPDVSAVAVCTTTQARYETARYALEQGRHVLLEKPPGMTVNEVRALIEIARKKAVTLFASWHSRHACAVEPARTWLLNRKINAITVTWKEDVRIWHPGQTWIWNAGGLGVFDPGINALSILTRIIPGALVLKEAELFCPKNSQTPIAARLLFNDQNAVPAHMELDFLHTGTPIWSINVDTDMGQLTLSMGGSVMNVNGEPVQTPEVMEYPDLYAHFATLIRDRRSDVDLAPLQLVADAFLCGHRTAVEPFVE